MDGNSALGRSKPSGQSPPAAASPPPTASSSSSSSPPPSPPTLSASDARDARIRQLQTEAITARDLTTPAALSLILGAEVTSPHGARVYLNGFHHDGGVDGDDGDPVERIMREQLLMAHHRVAQLHVQASNASDPELVKVLNTAAARLLGELRRMALAIRQYRAPISGGRSFSVVHQQNVVAGGGGGQQVTYVDQSVAGEDRVKLSARSEVAGNPQNGDAREQAFTPKEPQAGRGRAEEWVQASSVDG